MKTLLTSIRLLAVLTVLTGVVYPLLVWGVGQVAFRDRAEGSLVTHRGRAVGSALLAQQTTAPRYFHPRPSAADFATLPSGASNQSWTSAKLAADVAARRAALGGGADLPADLLTASASGLDPDLSVAAIRTQADRVATARGFDVARRHSLDDLIARLTVGGHLSPARVNVLELNLALDRTFP